jgi:hypothetical protein
MLEFTPLRSFCIFIKWFRSPTCSSWCGIYNCFILWHFEFSIKPLRIFFFFNLVVFRYDLGYLFVW